jgi:hypothetical protein
MATAQNNVSLTTSTVTLFDPSVDGRAAAFSITNRLASPGNVLVNIAGIHKAGDYLGIAPGLDYAFVNASGGIGVVTVKSDSTATIDCGIDRV